MNHRQKFGYTVLGAVIMLVGIGVGSIVSPPLVAQRDGVFGEIECPQLKVVDKAGKPAIMLIVNEEDNTVVVVDKMGNPAIALSTDEQETQVSIYNKAGKPVVVLAASEEANHVFIADKAGKPAVALAAVENEGNAVVFDKAGGIKWSTLDD